MPQLEFNTWMGQIFWLIFTFTIMYILMTVLVLPRMKNIADRREQKISGDLKRAEELNAEAESIVKDAQANLIHSQNEADAILTKAVENAQQATESRVSDAHKKLDAKLSEALNTIEKQKADAVAGLDSIVVEVATDTLNRVVAIKDAKKAVEAQLQKS